MSGVLSPLLFSFLISCRFPRQAEPVPAESDAALKGPLGIQRPNTLSEPGGGRNLDWEADKADGWWWWWCNVWGGETADKRSDEAIKAG